VTLSRMIPSFKSTPNVLDFVWLTALIVMLSGCYANEASTVTERPVILRLKVFDVSGTSNDMMFNVLDHGDREYIDLSTLEGAQSLKYIAEKGPPAPGAPPIGGAPGGALSLHDYAGRSGGLVPVDALRGSGELLFDYSRGNQTYRSSDASFTHILAGHFAVAGRDFFPVTPADCGLECEGEDSWRPLPLQFLAVPLTELSDNLRGCGLVVRFLVCNPPENVFGYYITDTMNG